MNIAATTSYQPSTQVTYEGRKRLNTAEWGELALALQTSIRAALGARELMDKNLDEWNDQYEQLVGEKDFPWENSSNFITPLTVTQLDSLVAYVAAQVLVPGRLFMVSGNTPDAQQFAAMVERYYNAELRRRRGDTTWYNELYQWLCLAARDGTGIMEAVWKYREVTTKATDRRPKMAPDENGNMAQSIDADGIPEFEDVPITMTDTFNDVTWEAVDLRNFYVIPMESTSIQQPTPAAVRVLYLYETDIKELANNPDAHFSDDEIELALAMVPNGNTELPSSMLPTGSYTAGQQIVLGSGQGTQSTKLFKNRGPIEVHRIHSNQYDLDGDGVPEENVFWYHISTMRLLGWMRYQYFNGQRPFFPFSLFPRFKRLWGFSLVERLLGLQKESDSIRNQRVDMGDLILAGVWLSPEGVLDRKRFKFGPQGFNEVSLEDCGGDIAKALVKVPLGEVPQSAFTEALYTKQDALEFTGLNSPMIGGMSPGRRSAAEAKQWQAAAATRTGLLAMRFRLAIQPLIEFTHALKKQYLEEDQSFAVNGEQFTIPVDVLKKDFNIDISGASDPIDANTRRAETLQALNEFMQMPLIQQSPIAQYYMIRRGMEAMGWSDVDKVLEQLQGVVQQQEQAMQQQRAAQAAGIPMGGGEQGGNGSTPNAPPNRDTGFSPGGPAGQ